MAKVRLLAPPNTSVVRHNVIQKGPSGITYDGSAGGFVDCEQHDSRLLVANGWIPVCDNDESQAGTTALRPTKDLYAGLQYMDTTLGYIVIFNGKNWIRPDTGAVV